MYYFKTFHRHHHHEFLTQAIGQRLMQINDVYFLRSFVKTSAPFNVSSSLVMSLCILSVLCFFFSWTMHLVYYVGFSQLAFSSLGQTFEVFAGQLCLTELFGDLRTVISLLLHVLYSFAKCLCGVSHCPLYASFAVTICDYKPSKIDDLIYLFNSWYYYF